MPFGIRSPSKYVEKHRELMLSTNTDSCHCCNAEISQDEKGFFKVVASRFKYLFEGVSNEQRALLCPSCYNKQRALDFNTLEDLQSHLETKQRLPRVASKPAERKKPNVEKPSVVRGSSFSLESIDRKFLVELHRMLGEYLVLCSPELCDNEPDSEDDGLGIDDDDDIFAGMTDEQRARMDQAVASAEARTTKVPKEEWNFK